MSPALDGALKSLTAELVGLVREVRSGRKAIVVRGWDGRTKHTIALEGNNGRND